MAERKRNEMAKRIRKSFRTESKINRYANIYLSMEYWEKQKFHG